MIEMQTIMPGSIGNRKKTAMASLLFIGRDLHLDDSNHQDFWKFGNLKDERASGYDYLQPERNMMRESLGISTSGMVW